MNGPQKSFTSSAGRAEPERGTIPQWAADDDFAIGFECANPALQIERWGQESEGALPETH